MERLSIAIDGPSGAGKSTLARMLAKNFGLIYVDTGALYRSIGLFVCRRGVASKDAEQVEKMLPEIKVELCYNDAGEQRMILNGEDVSEDIRLPEISIYASDVSAMPPVRKFLLDMQRDMARRYNVVMDGRDIGTVVLPEAGLKIFLTASAEERAKRRYEELQMKGVQTSFEDVLSDMIYRDKNDSSRAAAPLRPADDAVKVDTTGNTLERSFEVLSGIVKERMDYGA